MTQLTYNWRLFALFISTASVMAWILPMLAAKILEPKELLLAAKYLGIATTAGFLSITLLNRFLWKLPLIRSLVGIPDFNGRWEGWQFRTLDNMWVPIAIEITQRAFEISAASWGRKNKTRSTSAAIITDNHGGNPQLVWSYKAEVITPPSNPGDVHDGSHYLHLSASDGRKSLQGTYVNDRRRDDGTMGAVGFVSLVLVSSSKKGELAFKTEHEWGMAKPQ